MEQMTPFSHLDSALQQGALGLLGLLMCGGLVIAWVLVKSWLRQLERVGSSIERVGEKIDASAQLLLMRIDTGERSVQDNINDTRHGLRGAIGGARDTVVAEIGRSERRTEKSLDKLLDKVKTLPPPPPTAA